MENTQLQLVLQKLDTKSLKRFTEFLASPYFNKKKTLVDFWDNLKSFAPAFSPEKTEKEKIFREVTGKKFNDAYYRNMCSDMLQTVLHFISIENLENNSQTGRELIIESMAELGLYDMMEKQLKQSKAELEKPSIRYIEKLKQRIWLYDKGVTLQIRKNRNKHEGASKFIYEANYHFALMDYTLIKCFLILFNQQRAANTLGLEFNKEVAEKYITIYEEGLHTNDPFVRCYYLLAKLRFSNDLSYYPELKKLILKKDTGIVSYDLENLLVATLNFLSGLVESDETTWRNELMELYDFRLKKELWYMNGSLGYTSLDNIVFNALQLGKIKYAEQVVKKYTQYVDEAIQKDISQLCLAWIEFYKGNEQLAHTYLLHIETENILIKYELRLLQSMIYFTQKEYLVLLSYLDSFKHFLTYNHSLLESSVQQVKNKFLLYLTQLTKLRMDPNKKNTEKLKREIEAETFVLKEWLLKQL